MRRQDEGERLLKRALVKLRHANGIMEAVDRHETVSEHNLRIARVDLAEAIQFLDMAIMVADKLRTSIPANRRHL